MRKRSRIAVPMAVAAAALATASAAWACTELTGQTYLHGQALPNGAYVGSPTGTANEGAGTVTNAFADHVGADAPTGTWTLEGTKDPNPCHDTGNVSFGASDSLHRVPVKPDIGPVDGTPPSTATKADSYAVCFFDEATPEYPEGWATSPAFLTVL